MPSTTGVGSTDQRPPRRRRAAVLFVAGLAVLATVVPFVAVPAVAAPGGTGATASVAALPHGNTTDGNLTLLVGPDPSYDALDEFGDVATAHRRDVLERRDEVHVGDTLVLAFTSARLGAEYADTTGPNATVRLLQALEAEGGSLNVTSPAGTDCEPVQIDLLASRHRVLADAETGEFRLVYDTDVLEADGGCDGELDVPGGYEVTAVLPAANGTQRSEVRFGLLDGPETRAPRPRGEFEVRRGRPALVGDLRTAADVRRDRERGRLVRARQVVGGEVTVLTVESARLERAYANATGRNATHRLVRAANATGGRVAVDTRTVADGPGTETETEAADRRGVRLLGPGVRTLPDRANDTFHLVVDTRSARLREGGRTVALANATETALEAVAVVPGGEPERFLSRFQMEGPDGEVRVAQNRSVEGTRSLAVVGTDGRFVARPMTNLAPGSRLTVRVLADNETLATRSVRAEGRRRDVLESEQGESEQDGVVFDVGEQAAGRRLTVALSRRGSTFHQMTVLAGEQPTLRDASVRRVRSGPEGTLVRIGVTAHYPGPGYVVVQNASGQYVGFRVPGGEQTRVRETVMLRPGDPESPRRVQVIAVYDGDQDGQFDGPSTEGETDPPYRSADGRVLTRPLELPPASPTPTVTAPPPGTTLAVTDAGAPGFGPLAALTGLLGLIGVLGLRRGRRGSP